MVGLACKDEYIASEMVSVDAVERSRTMGAPMQNYSKLQMQGSVGGASLVHHGCVVQQPVVCMVCDTTCSVLACHTTKQ